MIGNILIWVFGTLLAVLTLFTAWAAGRFGE